MSYEVKTPEFPQRTSSFPLYPIDEDRGGPEVSLSITPTVSITHSSMGLSGKRLTIQTPSSSAEHSLSPETPVSILSGSLITPMSVASPKKFLFDTSRPSALFTKQVVQKTIAQKNYWQDGVWVGVYYLFVYWFAPKNVQPVMMQLSQKVYDAAKKEEQLSYEELSKYLLKEEKFSPSDIKNMLTYSPAWLLHMFGGEEAIQEFLLHLYIENTTDQLTENSVFKDLLLAALADQQEIKQAAENLFPSPIVSSEYCVVQSPSKPYRTRALELVQNAKNKLFYKSVSQNCGDDISSRMLTMYVIAQLKKELQKIFEGKGEEIQRSTQLSFDELLKNLSLLENLYALKTPHAKTFVEGFLENFREEIEPIQVNKLIQLVKREFDICNVLVAQFSDMQVLKLIVGDRKYHCFCAAFECVKGLREEKDEMQAAQIATITEIIDYFSAFSSLKMQVGDALIKTFFANLNQKYGASKGLALACRNGIELIDTFLGVEKARRLSGETVYWIASSYVSDGMQKKWDMNRVTDVASPLEKIFASELVLAVIEGRKKDFIALYGEENLEDVIKYIKVPKSKNQIIFISKSHDQDEKEEHKEELALRPDSRSYGEPSFVLSVEDL